MNNIVIFINKTRQRLAVCFLIENLLLWLIFSSSIYIFTALGDYFIFFTLGLRRSFYYLSASLFVYAVVRFLCSFLPFYKKDENVIRLMQKKIPELNDSVLCAWQLNRNRLSNVSSDLIDQHVNKCETALQRYRVSDAAGLTPFCAKLLNSLLLVFLVGTVLFYFPPYILKSSSGRILYSFCSYSWEESFEVLPGTNMYPVSKGVEIRVVKKKHIPGIPVIYIKFKGSRRTKYKMKPENTGSFSYRIDSLNEKADYSIGWNEIESSVFTLTPEFYPVIGDYRVRYKYPEYTALKEYESIGNTNISAVTGTNVIIEALCDKKLSSAFMETSYRERYTAEVSGYNIKIKFKVSKSGKYKIIVMPQNGIQDPEPAESEIILMEDNPPIIEMLSPKDDLTVQYPAEIPIVFNCSDDFGVDRIELVYQIENSSALRLDLKDGQNQWKLGISEYLWKMDKPGMVPGKIVRYYLEAWDNDTVNGTKSSVTLAHKIELTDYGREHEKLGHDLKILTEDLLQILAEQSSANNKIGDIITNYSSSTYKNITASQHFVSTGTEKSILTLDDILLRMSVDPFTDFAAYNEYRGLKSHLKYLRENQMEDAEIFIADMDFGSAKNKQEEIIAALEKICLLSEDIWRYQNMRDLFESAVQMEKYGKNLFDKLDSSTGSEELNKMLNELKKLLEEVSYKISKMPQELPEDFVNSGSVKELSMQSANDLVDQLCKAIEKGDFKSAKAVARKLKENLLSISGMLQQVGENVGFTHGAAELMKAETNRFSDEIRTIVQEQSSLYDRTEIVDGARRRKLFSFQEKIFESLEVKQRKYVGLAEEFYAGFRNNTGAGEFQIEKNIDLMKKTLTEFTEKRVYNSQKYLEDIVTKWDEAIKAIINNNMLNAEGNQLLAGKITEIRAGENEILTKLRSSASEDLFDVSEKIQLEKLAAEQGKLSVKTSGFRNSLEKFMSKSSAIEPENFGNLGKAETFMKKAGVDLFEKKTAGAMEYEIKALELLENVSKGIESAVSTMGKEGQLSGQGVGSSFQLRQGGPGFGRGIVPVKLPGVKDYRTPREFRQEILEALTEKYPKKYEKIIKDYYKQITE